MGNNANPVTALDVTFPSKSVMKDICRAKQDATTAGDTFSADLQLCAGHGPLPVTGLDYPVALLPHETAAAQQQLEEFFGRHQLSVVDATFQAPDVEVSDRTFLQLWRVAVTVA